MSRKDIGINATIIAGVCIICLTTLACFGIEHQQDTILLSGIVGAICTVFGVVFGIKVVAKKD